VFIANSPLLLIGWAAVASEMDRKAWDRRSPQRPCRVARTPPTPG